MDIEMVKLQTEVAGLRERVAALELADKAIQEKVARDVAAAKPQKKTYWKWKKAAAKDAAAKPQKQSYWKKKEATTVKK